MRNLLCRPQWHNENIPMSTDFSECYKTSVSIFTYLKNNFIHGDTEVLPDINAHAIHAKDYEQIVHKKEDK
jgi:hypothetical protein